MRLALGDRIGTAADIDDGMTLGMNYPTGPLEWADEIGLDHIVMILDGLHEEYGDERYPLPPLLRRITAFTSMSPSSAATANLTSHTAWRSEVRGHAANAL
jgi:3-hydroxyacyl-CoA dehydrogenase